MSEYPSPPMSRPLSHDRFSLAHLYIWLALGTLFYCSDLLDRVLRLSYLLVPIILVPTVIVVSVWLLCFLKSLWGRRWRSLAAVIFAPVGTIAVFGTLAKLHIDPDWIHFQFTRTSYLRQVHTASEGLPKHRFWDWGDTGSATGPNIGYFLVYDEADKPLSGDPAVDAPKGSISVRSMGDHFYVITETW